MTREQLEKGMKIRDDLNLAINVLEGLQHIDPKYCLICNCVGGGPQILLKEGGDKVADEVIKKIKILVTSRVQDLEKQLEEL